MMEPVKFNLPAGSVVKGEFYSLLDPDWLVQDMVEIDLPSGITIDVGWHPECDLNGSFRIVVFRDYWKNQLQPIVYTKNPLEVEEIVDTLAQKYSPPEILERASGETDSSEKKRRTG